MPPKFDPNEIKKGILFIFSYVAQGKIFIIFIT